MSPAVRIFSLSLLTMWVGTPALAQGEGAATDVAPAAAPAKTGPKVLVLPYQPIFRTVEQSKAQTATDLLQKELGQKEGLIAVRGAVAQEGAKGPTLEEATKLSADAEAAETNRDIVQAIDLRKKAVESLERNASAIADANEFLLGYHKWARALMWAAKDKEAQVVLDTVARMEPAFELDASQFSRQYRAWFKAAVEKVMKEDRGELMVKSALPGARITLDGRLMDVAPVLLTKAVPGKHLLGATIDGVPPYAALVEIKAGKKNEFTANFGGVVGGDTVGDVAEAITTNGLPKKAVDAAVKSGQAAGAEFVVLGGLTKDDNHFNVYTFVLEVKSGLVRTLEQVNFDLDLLTAESDVLRVVQQIAASVSAFSEGKPQIAAIDAKVRSQSVVNEVSAAPTLVAQAKAPKAPVGKTPRGPITKGKGGTIQIKDE